MGVGVLAVTEGGRIPDLTNSRRSIGVHASDGGMEKKKDAVRGRGKKARHGNRRLMDSQAMVASLPVRV